MLNLTVNGKNYQFDLETEDLWYVLPIEIKVKQYVSKNTKEYNDVVATIAKATV